MAEEEKQCTQAEANTITDIICRKDIAEVKKYSDLIKTRFQEFAGIAVAVDDREILKLFISWGLLENCFAQHRQSGAQSILSSCVYNGRIECLKILLGSILEKYGSFTARDNASILMQALPRLNNSSLNLQEVLDVLFNFGADINQTFIVRKAFHNDDKIRTTLFHNYMAAAAFADAEKILSIPRFNLDRAVGIDGGYALIKHLINASYVPGSPLMEKILSAKTLDIRKPPAGEVNLITYSIKSSLRDSYMLPMIKILINAGVELGDIDDPSSAAYAAAKCDNEAVRRLIDEQIGRPCAPKLTASQERMFKAIRQNDIDALAKEIQKGVDVNIQKNPFTNRITPLMLAVITGASSQIVKMLLEAGADPNVKDIKGNAPINMISIYPSEGMYTTSGSSFASRGTYNGVKMQCRRKVTNTDEIIETAVQMFANTRDTAELIISAGANVTEKDQKVAENLVRDFEWNYGGRNGRQWSEENGRRLVEAADAIADTVYMMIKGGSDIDLGSLFRASVCSGNIDMAKRLMPQDYDVNEKITVPAVVSNMNSDYETTIFIKAVKDDCKIDVLEFLLDLGADITAKDSKGHDAEHYVLDHAQSWRYAGSEYKDQYYSLIERKRMEKILETEDAVHARSTDFEFDI